MTATPERVARAVALELGEGEAIWFLHGRMTIKATGQSTQGGYGLTEAVIPPGFSPPLHIHDREDESFYLVEGELTLRCGDQTYSATAGSFIFHPRGVPYSFVVESDRPVRMLNLMTPGGGEGFFIEAGRPAQDEGLPPGGPIDIEQLRRVSEKYGAEVVGPPSPPRRSADRLGGGRSEVSPIATPDLCSVADRAANPIAT
jgi:mannose-6-phosphate isomerase-like protein (cupin superfamily)